MKPIRHESPAGPYWYHPDHPDCQDGAVLWEEPEEPTTNCCNAIFHEPGYPDNDLCSQCGEHAEPNNKKRIILTMRSTPYGEPSDKEIDALHPPPTCPQCGEDVEDYDQLCESCETQNQLEHQADILQDDLKYNDL